MIIKIGNMYLYNIHYKNGILELLEFTGDINFAIKYKDKRDLNELVNTINKHLNINNVKIIEVKDNE